MMMDDTKKRNDSSQPTDENEGQVRPEGTPAEGTEREDSAQGEEQPKTNA